MATYKLVNVDQLDSDLTAVGNAIRSKGGTSARLSFPAGMVSSIGAISTGVELNFDVVGGTSQPSNPKENTIWVNTSETITDWVFSATQPTVASGRVWFPTSTSSTVEFNALKKNAIQVYPISVKQYINGAWVVLDAYCYQNGELIQFSVAWNGELYDTGNQYQSITGGWTGYGEDGATAKRVTFNTSNISIATKSNAEAASAYTKNKLDLSKFNKLNVELNVTGVNTALSDTVSIGVASVNNVAYASNKAVAKNNSNSTGARTLTCDISSVDEGYPYVCANESNFVVSKIWLE